MPECIEIETNLQLNWGMAFINKDSTARNAYLLELEQMRRDRKYYFKSQCEG